MKTNVTIVFCVIAWIGICAGLVVAGLKERDKRYAEFSQTMKDQNCKRTGFAGKDATPVWTCPDGTAYKEGWL